MKSILGLLLGLLIVSCDDFVKIDPPRTALVKETVFDTDATAEAAMLDIYFQMKSYSFASGDRESLTFLMSISSDEQNNFFTGGGPVDAEYQQFNDNSLLTNNSVSSVNWTSLYNCIYKANAVIEGVATSKGISPAMRNQLTGEAKFMRGFCHFYLVNLWGDVPLAVTTDYRVNSELARTPVADVYQQIIFDLTDAQSLLPSDYSVSNNERVRVNKAVATAMLARVYLYNQNWSNAESQATQLINDTQFALASNMSEVMLTTSQEAIWQFWSDYYPKDFFTFFIYGLPTAGALREEFINDFEPGDQRAADWISSFTTEESFTYYFSFKYSSYVPATEYSTIMRLAEQYLIRAEARIQQDNIAGAQEDINVIRHRAGLGDTPASDKPSLLLAIEQERRSELFNEWGHRWFDLKRTGRVDAVLGSIKPHWSSTSALLPIPQTEMINNPGLKGAQNPGY